MTSATAYTPIGKRLLPDMPLPVWMILITLTILLWQDSDPSVVIAAFNAGWGHALGEFALILLPSFVLSAALDRQQVEAPPLMTVGLAPFSAAGMVCSDTAYAALSPMSKQGRLEIAFGSYTGFKLLFPAGPLIVATGVGVTDKWLLAASAALFLPVFAVGFIYARRFRPSGITVAEGRGQVALPYTLLVPFGALFLLLTSGMLIDGPEASLTAFLLNPKGALLVAAALALAMLPHQHRRPSLDSGLMRTASLLTIIGAASAFSFALTSLIPVAEWFAESDGFWALLGLFGLSALFKLLQGSSMSTFAAIGPLAAPIVAAANLPSIAAVLVICLGSFVAIAPNDSFYWLVRQSALPDESEMRATFILAIGSMLQALAGLILVLAISAMF